LRKEGSLMSEQENVEIVKQGYAAFQRGDIQTILNLGSDDVEVRHPMSLAIWPWAGKGRGRTRLAEFFVGLGKLVEFERFEPREFIAQGDKVVVLLFERVRLRATSRVVESEHVHVFTLRNGKVVQWDEYQDTAPFIAAMRDQEAI